jgi:hypothetical protein
MLHLWVEQQSGKLLMCAQCGTTDAKIYDWPNLSGRYIRTSMTGFACVGRATLFLIVGVIATKPYVKEATPLLGNVYNHPTKGRMCRACKSANQKIYMAAWWKGKQAGKELLKEATK